MSPLLRLVLCSMLLVIRLSSPPERALLPPLLRIVRYYMTERHSSVVHTYSGNPEYCVFSVLVVCLIFHDIVRCDHGPVVQSFKSALFDQPLIDQAVNRYVRTIGLRLGQYHSMSPSASVCRCKHNMTIENTYFRLIQTQAFARCHAVLKGVWSRVVILRTTSNPKHNRCAALSLTMQLQKGYLGSTGNTTTDAESGAPSTLGNKEEVRRDFTLDTFIER